MTKTVQVLPVDDAAPPKPKSNGVAVHTTENNRSDSDSDRKDRDKRERKDRDKDKGHKDKDKHNDGSKDKHKERHGDRHKDKHDDKHRDKHDNRRKDKQHDDRHKDKHDDKHKDKHDNRRKDKQHDDRHKDKRDSKHNEKHDDRRKDKHDNRVKDKNDDKYKEKRDDKHKDRRDDKHKDTGFDDKKKKTISEMEEGCRDDEHHGLQSTSNTLSSGVVGKNQKKSDADCVSEFAPLKECWTECDEDLEKRAELLSPGARLQRSGSKYGVEALDIFFNEVNSQVDSLSKYMPASNEDPVLSSITEILFKPYPITLKIFAYLLWWCQFFTLAALFYTMLPCPEEKVSWAVVVGIPLCCGYAGIESVHQMMRYLHLGRSHRCLVFMMQINALLQLLCVGVVMGKSVNLLELISNFVGVAIVLQVDELLASYIRIRDIDTDLLTEKSWQIRMLMRSKIGLVILFGLCVYLVTLAIWYTDRWYCQDIDY